MSESPDNRKAKEILSSLSQREPVGDQILSRVGHRFFGRFNAATSARLFELYDIPDPYQPEAYDSKWAVKLGPVSLRLGENRRQPAPHLTVREPKKSKENPNIGAQFRPKGIPEAKRTPPPPPPKPKTTPAPKSVQPSNGKPEVQSPEHPPIPKSNAHVPKRNRSELASEFGMRPSPEKQAPASIPVRPDVIQALVDKGAKLPPHLQAQYEAMKSEQASPASSAAPQSSASPHRHMPKSQTQSSNKISQSGRLRMRPQRRSKPTVITETVSSSFEPFPVSKADAAPIEDSPKSNESKQAKHSVPLQATPDTQSQPSPQKPISSSPPINRSPSAGGGSLDDLFGFTGQGRMRVGKPKKRRPSGPNPSTASDSEPSDK